MGSREDDDCIEWTGAAAYGISRQNVRNIGKRETWTHV